MPQESPLGASKMDSFEDLRLATVRELADSMRAAKRHWDNQLHINGGSQPQPENLPYADPLPAIFLIGAGCSVSAGIKSATGMAKELILGAVEDLGGPNIVSPVEAYNWLRRYRSDVWPFPPQPREELIDWPIVYDHLFSHLYASPDHQRRIFARYTNLAQTGLNWAHLCLGELVRSRYISTVLSTNFDQLALEGMIAANVFPVICDGFETLDRLEPAPSTPQLVQIHGSSHAYRLRNNVLDVALGSRDGRVRASLGALLQSAKVFVAIGYGGREVGFMSSLVGAAKHYPDKALYWAMHSDNPASLAEQPRALLSTSHNARLLIGRDADTFFAELLRELGLEAPQLTREPLTMLLDQNERIKRMVSPPPLAGYCIQAFREDLETLKKSLEEFHSTPERQALRAAQTELSRNHGREAFEAIRDYSKECEARWTPRIMDVFVQILAYHIADIGSNDVDWALSRMDWILSKEDAAGEAVYVVLAAATGERQLQLREEWPAYVKLLKQVVEKYYDAKEPIRLIEEKRVELRRNLGIALKTVGKNDRDTKKLWMSRDCFDSALKPNLKNERPLEWANVFQNRGSVYHILGTGNRGRWQSDATLVQKAVDDYEKALEERKRARQPHLWARLMNSLGNARRWLGEYGPGQGKEAYLTDAIRAYEEVLQLPMNERGASARAQTLSRLGLAWELLGHVRIGKNEYIRAREVYDEAESLFEKISERVDGEGNGDDVNESRRLTKDGLLRVEAALK